MVGEEAVLFPEDRTQRERGQQNKDDHQQLGEVGGFVVVDKLEPLFAKSLMNNLLSDHAPGEVAVGKHVQLGVERGVEHLEHREKEIDQVQDEEHLQGLHIHHPAAVDIFA